MSEFKFFFALFDSPFAYSRSLAVLGFWRWHWGKPFLRLSCEQL